MKLKPKDIIIPTLVLFIIALLTTALLAGTNVLTVDKIAEQDQLAQTQARQQVLPDAESFDVKQLSSPGEGTKAEYFVGTRSGKIVGYVFSTSHTGYGGLVNVMTGISSDGKVTGVAIVSHNETPGLGANAEKDSFRDQYKKPAPKKGFDLIKTGTPDDSQILAMTGATITSRAVTNSVDKAIVAYQSIKEGT